MSSDNFRDAVEHLVCRKYPETCRPDWEMRCAKQPELEQIEKQAEAYRAELEAKPYRELTYLLLEEQEKEQEEMWIAEGQFQFNWPEANADFPHWAKLGHQTLHIPPNSYAEVTASGRKMHLGAVAGIDPANPS